MAVTLARDESIGAAKAKAIRAAAALRVELPGS
jgi:phosphoribosylglycinamide formyltransferase 2